MIDSLKRNFIVSVNKLHGEKWLLYLSNGTKELQKFKSTGNNFQVNLWKRIIWFAVISIVDNFNTTTYHLKDQL